MASLALQDRIAFLLESQNPDGGWGYFRGRRSWTEPTAWAMLALHGRAGGEAAWNRGWELVRSWQSSDGGCRPGPEVREASWVTALWVTLHCVRGTHDAPFGRGVEWLVRERGVEGAWWRRTLRSLGGEQESFNPAWCGWSWWPGTSSWLEPTVHALVALRKVEASGHGTARVRQRVAEAERMLLDRRCADGGWNYGVREALGQALPSYPETTGMALAALSGNGDASVKAAAGHAGTMRATARSAMGRAWLKVAMRLWGERVEDTEGRAAGGDVQRAALEAIGAVDGNWALLGIGGKS
jgi:hypothetical protein